MAAAINSFGVYPADFAEVDKPTTGRPAHGHTKHPRYRPTGSFGAPQMTLVPKNRTLGLYVLRLGRASAQQLRHKKIGAPDCSNAFSCWLEAGVG